MSIFEKYLVESTYTVMELNKLKKANNVLVNAQFKDELGNSTKWLGLNDTEALMALKKWIDGRLKMIKQGMK
jgi:hypothetical protein